MKVGRITELSNNELWNVIDNLEKQIIDQNETIAKLNEDNLWTMRELKKLQDTVIHNSCLLEKALWELKRLKCISTGVA